MSLEDNVIRAVDARDARLIESIASRDRAWEQFLESTNIDDDDPAIDAKFEEWLEEQKEIAAQYRIDCDEFWTGW